ncbi:MAG: FAD-dependent oxidoreductase [Pseudomonadota bacterium]
MHIVVVGNSIAADCLLGELFQRRQQQAVSVTVIGAEHHSAYNRVQLSQVLAGDADSSAIALRDTDWYTGNGVRLMTGVQVTSIDRSTQRVHLDSGDDLAYDKLVLATGARARVPAAADASLAGVQVFRTLDDARALIDTPASEHTVVFGGGLLGLEAAAGLLARGRTVTLVHRNGWLLNRQLDDAAGRLLLDNLVARGLSVHLNAELATVNGDTAVQSVTLDDGTEIPAQQLVFATGIEPRTELAVDAALAVNRGVVVDRSLQTADPVVFALGECAECAGETVGLVPPIRDHAAVLADTLLGRPGQPYVRREHATQLKVAGIDVFSAGDVNAHTDHVILFDDPLTPARRKLVLEDGRLVAIMLYGDVRDGPWLHSVMQNGTDTHALRDRLLFGRAYCEGLAA